MLKKLIGEGFVTVLLSLFLILLFVLPSFAQTVTPILSWVEPTTNVDTTALTDLAKTTLYYKIGTGSYVKYGDVAATKTTGGGTVTLTTSIAVSNGAITVLTFVATATDTSGNESVYSNTVSKTYDFLAPANPTGLAVQ
jgi:hypothetical protein